MRGGTFQSGYTNIIIWPSQLSLLQLPSWPRIFSFAIAIPCERRSGLSGSILQLRSRSAFSVLFCIWYFRMGIRNPISCFMASVMEQGFSSVTSWCKYRCGNLIVPGFSRIWLNCGVGGNGRP
ncbi:hypothetical protein JT06_09920 [Desulfobulbus sp. Tol-SR]|nr:hypothetical protein JT06_09920 [Desulfobulbus sp. Tol-SR]